MNETNEQFKRYTIPNTKLGYGTDEIQWNEKQYQEALREQKKLWLQKIESDTRYIGKQKFKMTTQAPQYFAALKREQGLNTKLGYGTDEIL